MVFNIEIYIWKQQYLCYANRSMYTHNYTVHPFVTLNFYNIFIIRHVKLSLIVMNKLFVAEKTLSQYDSLINHIAVIKK